MTEDAEWSLDDLARRLRRLPEPSLPPPSREGASGDAKAAVALVLRAPQKGGSAEILFIRRAERPHDPWSGHIAFPGGRHDARDATLFDTAVRETREEVGLDLAQGASMLARLRDVQARARGKRMGMTVAPYVFAIESHDPPLTLEAREVAEAIWMPLRSLARGDGAGTHVFEASGERYELPSLPVGNHVLWGLTYGMVTNFLAALATIR